MTEQKVRRVNYYPDAMIAGVAREMSLFDFGVYWCICTLIYSRGDDIPDDHKKIAGMFEGTHWREVRASIDRLVALGKVSQDGGKLGVKQCSKELQEARKRISSASQKGLKGGRPSSKNKDLEKATALWDEKLTNNYQLSTIKSSENTASPAAEVIKVFDDVLVSVWGPEQARPWPKQGDLKTAEAWLASGATVDAIRFALNAKMAAYKARGGHPPASLAFFNASMATLVAENGSGHSAASVAPRTKVRFPSGVLWDGCGMHPIWGPEFSRVYVTIKGNGWSEHWGPGPGQEGCRIGPAQWKRIEEDVRFYLDQLSTPSVSM